MRDRQSIFFSSPAIDLEGNEQGESLNSTRSVAEHSERAEEEEHLDDPLGIGNLSKSFEQLVEKINDRVTQLSTQALHSAQGEQSAIERSQIRKSDDEIKRLRRLISQCEEFELDFLKIGQIADIAKEFKARIQALEKDVYA